jgi:hypothetical protein
MIEISLPRGKGTYLHIMPAGLLSAFDADCNVSPAGTVSETGVVSEPVEHARCCSVSSAARGARVADARNQSRGTVLLSDALQALSFLRSVFNEGAFVD